MRDEVTRVVEGLSPGLVELDNPSSLTRADLTRVLRDMSSMEMLRQPERFDPEEVPERGEWRRSCGVRSHARELAHRRRRC